MQALPQLPTPLLLLLMRLMVQVAPAPLASPLLLRPLMMEALLVLLLLLSMHLWAQRAQLALMQQLICLVMLAVRPVPSLPLPLPLSQLVVLKPALVLDLLVATLVKGTVQLVTVTVLLVAALVKRTVQLVTVIV